jgi:hypothetical protein
VQPVYRRTSVRELHLAFKILYVYDYVTKLCKKQAELILNHANPNVRDIGQGEARDRKYKKFKLGGCKAYDRSADYLQFQSTSMRHNLLHKPSLTENLCIRCINVT